MTSVIALPRRRLGVATRAGRNRLRHPGPPPGERTGTFIVLVAVVLVLVPFGLVMVLSSSSLVALEESRSTWSYVARQTAWAALGSIGLVAALWSSPQTWRRWCRLALIAVLGLLAAVLVVGPTINGARRWIGFGPFTMQPSELAKIALILVCADLLAPRPGREISRRWALSIIAVLVVVVSGLVLREPNMGTTLIIVAIVGAIVFAAGARLTTLLGASVLCGLVAVHQVVSKPYRQRRLVAMMDPWANGDDSGYQALQAGVGFADGGLTGLGLGQSKAKWGYLPFAHTDFVFAIIGEELGLIGALVIVALFVAVAFLGVRAASRAADPFCALVAAGITTWIVAQAFLNIGVVVGLLPNTGVPLPFVSYGGSSLLVTMIGIGMLLNIARHPAAERLAEPL